MAVIRVKKLDPRARIPQRMSPGAVGYDVWACRVLDKITKKVVGELPAEIPPGESVLIGIGVAFVVLGGYQCEVRPRSGLASKYGIELSNSPGTVDPDFRGEVGILLRNREQTPFIVKPEMRIAQLVFTPVQIPVFEEVDKLPETIRGIGGFGSTGLFGIGFGTVQYEQEIARMDRYFMEITLSTSALSNCVRGMKRDETGEFPRDERDRLISQTHRFGCLIVKDNNIIGIGYNAQYPGSPLCSEVGCLRDEKGIESGTRLEICQAIHAEEMALNKVAQSNNSTLGATMYVNAEPCLSCAKRIAGSGIETVVIVEGAYPTNGIEILKEAGINIRCVEMPNEQAVRQEKGE